MRLYWRPQTRASRVEWVLAEPGEPVERVLAPDSGRVERFELHPLGRVPVLEDDAGVRRFESVALCTWLADRRPERGLIPPAGSSERATHDQWLMLAVTEVEPQLDLICRNPSIVSWATDRLAEPLRASSAPWRDGLRTYRERLLQRPTARRLFTEAPPC